MGLAIVTGASSGLGTEYARVLAKDDAIDQIWLIARRKDRLDKLCADIGEKARAIAMDICEPDAPQKFAELLQGQKIAALINNAGFGKLGRLSDMGYEDQARMVDLNCRAVTAFTTVALPHIERGGYILNVCSIAAFAPNPRMTVYCSTKAYIFSFSKSLREELKPRGINCLAVCPGPMNTEFLDVAGIRGGKSKTFETLPYCNPAQVAQRSVEKAKQGKAVYTNRLFFKFYRVLAKLLPHGLIMKFSKT